MQNQDELLDRVMEEARADGWWRNGESVAVAVSGGPDSMALLHMLCKMREAEPYSLAAAHVDHRFRGAESEAEARLVREAAESWGVPLESAEIDVPAYIAKTGKNTQEAARELRYAFLIDTTRKHGAHKLLLGHHADDQAETVLMRVLRGTGVGGLAGIPYRRTEKNVELIRPLLRITKRELLAYCERNGVPYAVDSSNLSRHYFRNAVRLDVMPMLEEHNPQLKASLIRLADLAGADDDYMEAETADLFHRIVTRSGEGFRWERRRFRGLHVALQRRLIKLILRCSSGHSHSLEYRQVEQLIHAAAAESPTVTRIELEGGMTFLREYDNLYVGPDRVEAQSFRYPLPKEDGELTIVETGHRFRIRTIHGIQSSSPDYRREAFFDEAELRLPLAFRSRQPGDRMEPQGLNGTKKVQDMFVDAKVPRSERDRIPLLEDGEGRVLWIPGLRRSKIALISGSTRSVLHVAVIAAPTSSGHIPGHEPG